LDELFWSAGQGCERFFDAAGGSGSDALVDGERFPQEGGACDIAGRRLRQRA